MFKALASVTGYVHDAVVGSCDLNTRSYNDFMQDALVLSKAGPGDKIYFGVGNRPHLAGAGGRGLVNGLERRVGIVDGDRLSVARDCLVWSYTFANNYQDKIPIKYFLNSCGIDKTDLATLEKVKATFEYQVMIYQNALGNDKETLNQGFFSEKSTFFPVKSTNDTIAAIENFKLAAGNIQCLTQKYMNKYKEIESQRAREIASQAGARIRKALAGVIQDNARVE